MTPDPNAIPDHEIQAYLDGELPRSRMIEIEAHLSRDADAAVALMADMRSWNEVRLAYGGRSDEPTRENVAAARRLERGLVRRMWMGRVRRGVAIMALVGSGWLAHAALGPWIISRVSAFDLPPAYVADAVRAYKATELRLSMASQIESRAIDAFEIRAATEIIVPDLPESWEVEDVQVFPSTQGPSLQIAIQTNAFGLVTLFAVRSDTTDITAPVLTRSEGFTTAHWQVGNIDYALVAKVDTPLLEAAIGTLADQPSTSALP